MRIVCESSGYTHRVRPRGGFPTGLDVSNNRDLFYCLPVSRLDPPLSHKDGTRRRRVRLYDAARAAATLREDFLEDWTHAESRSRPSRAPPPGRTPAPGTALIPLASDAAHQPPSSALRRESARTPSKRAGAPRRRQPAPPSRIATRGTRLQHTCLGTPTRARVARVVRVYRTVWRQAPACPTLACPRAHHRRGRAPSLLTYSPPSARPPTPPPTLSHHPSSGGPTTPRCLCICHPRSLRPDASALHYQRTAWR